MRHVLQGKKDESTKRAKPIFMILDQTIEANIFAFSFLKKEQKYPTLMQLTSNYGHKMDQTSEH